MGVGVGVCFTERRAGGWVRGPTPRQAWGCLVLSSSISGASLINQFLLPPINLNFFFHIL